MLFNKSRSEQQSREKAPVKRRPANKPHLGASNQAMKNQALVNLSHQYTGYRVADSLENSRKFTRSDMRRPTMAELRLLYELRRPVQQAEMAQEFEANSVLPQPDCTWDWQSSSSTTEEGMQLNPEARDTEQAIQEGEIVNDGARSPTAAEQEIVRYSTRRSMAFEFERPVITNELKKRDPNRTEMLAMPRKGPVRSARGTIEMVIQGGGRILTPQYNTIGILLSVTTSDGYAFVMTPDRRTWQIINRRGQKLNERPIKSVMFDKKGNLTYVTVDGTRTVLNLDGSVTAA